MPRVFHISQPSIPRGVNYDIHKLDALPRWGEVHVLLRAGEDPRHDPQTCLQRVRSRLAEFNPEGDFIAWVGGDILAALLVGAALCDLANDEGAPFTHVQYLSWCRARGADGSRTDAGGHFEVLSVQLADLVQAP